jgi:hypothetical protein
VIKGRDFDLSKKYLTDGLSLVSEMTTLSDGENGRYCYPLTVTDHASRFLLMCEALESTREDLAVTAFERLFAERGLLDGHAQR